MFEDQGTQVCDGVPVGLAPWCTPGVLLPRVDVRKRDFATKGEALAGFVARPCREGVAEGLADAAGLGSTVVTQKIPHASMTAGGSSSAARDSLTSAAAGAAAGVQTGNSQAHKQCPQQESSC